MKKKNFLLTILWVLLFGSAILCPKFNIGSRFQYLRVTSMLFAMIGGGLMIANLSKNLYIRQKKKLQEYIDNTIIFTPLIMVVIIFFLLLFIIVKINYTPSFALLFWIGLISIKKRQEGTMARIIERIIIPNNNKLLSNIKIFISLILPFIIIK